MKTFDTIAAVATPRGKGGVAMIRISGAEAVRIASRVFFPKSGRNLTELEANRTFYGEIKELSSFGAGETIDDGIAVIYRAPHSFTGEDTVELCCHGGVLVTESVLAACFAAGCRPAEAGEFTRRAFIYGKMSLSQAEDLGALLEAKTRGQLLLSRGGMAGHLAREIRAVYEGLRHILASVYAKIDFPDEDLATLEEKEMLAILTDAKEKLLSLEKTYKVGHAVREGIKTVICGSANAGKSSLYNRIVGRDAAIVTDIEGTTRDVLEQTAALGKVTILLCDTAGLRQTDDRVESIGIERSRDAMAEAELILAVFDLSKPLSEDDEMLIGELSGRSDVIAVLNKCDSPNFSDSAAEMISKNFKNSIRLSAKTGAGMEDLVSITERLFDCGDIDLSCDAIVSGARQHASIIRAIDHIASATKALSLGLTVDLCGTDIECAMAALGEIDGREVTEDIVSDIFSHFCVGK
ncbi:MAG: tRNA uridine-5-carboxymethylaminomethyl(34) synthesis GTPase MnmE [Clostridia bacterium]|nr:tRNA uridine-5-carboxymethylaminomethyl(34) synthesis GTPase MnmE [Clostridia bacterium]